MANVAEDSEWTVWTAETHSRRVRATLRALRTGWSDLKAAQGLGWELFRRDFSARYRESYLGYVWAILPSLGVAVVLTLASRGGIVNTGATGIPYPVVVLAGTALWQTFSEALLGPVQGINQAKPLLAKVRFPYEAILLAKLWECGLNVAIRAVLVAGAMIAYQIPVTAALLLVPVGIAALIVLGTALGLLLSPLAGLYNDVTQGMALGIGFWMFLTPVVYLAANPGSMVAWANQFNPVTPLLVSSRGWLLGTEWSDPVGFGVVVSVSTVLLVVAWQVWRFAMTFVVERAGS